MGEDSSHWAGGAAHGVREGRRGGNAESGMREDAGEEGMGAPCSAPPPAVLQALILHSGQLTWPAALRADRRRFFNGTASGPCCGCAPCATGERGHAAGRCSLFPSCMEGVRDAGVVVNAPQPDGYSSRELAPFPVIRVATAMPDGCNEDPLAADEVGHVVGEARNIDTAEAAAPLAPEQRLPEDGPADVLDFGAKTNA